MLLDAVSPLAKWANFYVITGSSAGALIGLMFVVITLIQGRVQPGASRGLGVYTTPTIVHFSAVLAISATLSAPWPALWQAALLLGLSGLVCLAYTAVVIRRLGNSVSYDPVLEDWLFHAVSPSVAYGTLVVAAFVLPDAPAPALFAIGAAMVLLLLSGIHNAWDTVTYIAIVRPAIEAESKNEKQD